MGGISVWQLLIIAVIVLVLFGSGRLRNLGSDLGTAIKGFKKSVADEPEANEQLNVKPEPKATEQGSAKEKQESK